MFASCQWVTGHRGRPEIRIFPHRPFDALATRLSARLSRRPPGVMGSILSGGPLWPDGAGARQRKKPCPPCRARKSKKGKCKKRLSDGTACGDTPCRVCQAGVCAVAGDGTACGNSPCRACTAGVCGNVPDDSACDGSGRCLAGQCNPVPTCKSLGSQCVLTDSSQCCSGICEEVEVLGSICRGPSPTGAPCFDNGECTSRQCVGFRCK